MGRILRPILMVFALAGLGLTAMPLRAQTVVKSPNVTAQLMAEHASVRPGGTLWVALKFKIRPGWHTYWRNAGDSGQPTQIQWTLPKGYSAGPIVWTAPHHHRVGPLMNYGYADEAVHLVPITVPKDAKPGTMVTLKAHGMWLVCENICVPEEGRFSLSVFVAEDPPAPNTQFEATFTKARQAVAKKSPWTATVHRSGKNVLLQLKGAALRRDKVQEVWFYPYQPGVIRHVAKQTPNFGTKVFTLWMTAKKQAAGKPLEGVLVVTEKLDGGVVRQAFAIRALPGDAAVAVAGGGGDGSAGGATNTAEGGAAGSDGGGLTLLMALIFALIGGMILNLMPCVLPVLSMKALSLVQHARTDGAAQRRHGWAYTLGVLGTFALITAVLIVLRAAGEEIGWGYQLQSPVVVLVLAWVMFVIGLYLAGLFEIGGRIAGVGQGLASRGGYSGSFFTGMLAVVAAAPCTVPFMGAAMGFAFVQSWPVTVVVMLALGLGLALPFLLLSHAPVLLRFIPKPGPWMERFKQFLSFPMFGTAVWLTWVLTLQAGDVALIAALGGAVLIAFVIWLMRAANGASGMARGIAGVAALLAVFAIGGMTQYALQNADGATARGANRTAEGTTPLFTPARLEAARASGKAVFINYTAAWCVTCIVNEKGVLSAAWFRPAMDKAGIIYMKGDWTRRDPAITRELKKFGRLGVPLYVFYPAAGSSLKPEVLPQILTESRLRVAIGKYTTTDPQRASKR